MLCVFPIHQHCYFLRLNGNFIKQELPEITHITVSYVQVNRSCISEKYVRITVSGSGYPMARMNGPAIVLPRNSRAQSDRSVLCEILGSCSYSAVTEKFTLDHRESLHVHTVHVVPIKAAST